MEFHIIDQYEDFCLLEDDWEDLLTRIENPQVFYKFQWTKNYLEYYDPQQMDMLCIVLGYENKKLMALFPFVLINKTIRFITNQATDYNMVYVDNSINRFSAMKKGIEHLLENKQIDRFHLNNFPGSSELYLLEEVLREIEYSAFIEESTFTAKTRVSELTKEKFNKAEVKNIHTKERKLQKEHIVEIKYSNTLSEDVLLFMIKHKINKYKDSALKYENMRNFISGLSKEMKCNIFIGALYIDEELAATKFGFVDNKTIYSYISTYDFQYSKDGVGKLLNYKLLEENNGKRTVDFLRGNEKYKFDFCDEVNMNFNLLAFKKGISFALMQRAKSVLKNNHFIRKLRGR